MVRLSSRSWFGALALLGLAANGCTSRTLPLPPPAAPEVTPIPGQPGMVRVTGLAHEGAAVGVLNEATFQGVITTSTEEGCDRSCPFEATLAAEPGNEIRLWQFMDSENPAHVTVE